MDAATPELIPVRALNQVSYCPRLYYLEYVESVMPINEFVEDGLFQHRRVNDPGAGQPNPQGRRRPAYPQCLALLRAPGDLGQARPARRARRCDSTGRDQAVGGS